MTEIIPKKKILIDTTFLFDQYASRGIGRYGIELLKRLLPIIIQENSYDLNLIGYLGLEQNLIELGLSQFSIDNIASKITFHSFGKPKASGISNIVNWNKLYIPIIEQVQPTLFFATHFERGLPSNKLLSMNKEFKTKSIVMVHDAIPLATNSFSQKGFIQNQIKKIFYKFMWHGVQNADLILTNSNYSKADIIRFGKVNSEKIHTIYLGIDKSFFRENLQYTDEIMNRTLETYELKDQKYFFYDSGIEANKGIKNLINIFSLLKNKKHNKIPNKLVIVGGSFTKGSGFSIKPKSEAARSILKFCKELNVLDDIITTGRISDDDLKILLFNSSVYMSLSHYEGFSFGPLQAMAAGIPAIAANASCIPEITDGGALLINPNDFNLGAEEVYNYLIQEDKVNERIQKGKEIAKRYDWNVTAEKTWELIKLMAIS